MRITPQSATKVHPSGGRLASLTTQIHVERDAELVLDNEPIIPFAESRFSQKTRIEVEPGARLVFWEGLMAGRIGKDELWQFDEFTSETRIEMNGRPLFLDRFSLAPKHPHPNSEWVMRNAAYVGTGLYFGADALEAAENSHDALPEAGVDSLSPDFAVVRVATTSGPEFHRARAMFAALNSAR